MQKTFFNDSDNIEIPNNFFSKFSLNVKQL